MAGRETDIGTKFAGWLGLLHPPFHTVGIFPFILGTVLAWRVDTGFNITVLLLSTLGVVLVMLATYHAEEYFSYAEDERSPHLFRYPLAGGSGAIPDEKRPRSIALFISLLTISLAMIIGLILQFGLQTGPLTLLLGCLGALPGLLYSTRFIRLFETGLGELFIGFCYGWLPLAAAFYIQRGYIAPCIHWMALPIGLSIFNVILLNEFPHYSAGAAVGKTNLLLRLGTTKGMSIYVLFSILSWFCMYFSIGAGIPRKALYLYLPVVALSAGISLIMARRKYENPLLLELLCGLNIAVYLGTTMAYILAFL
ncbi:MAG: prenyltransferase [Proteobacteria bacterium]|nr:prenyltransferase [Pseudomonadota bacterium]